MKILYVLPQIANFGGLVRVLSVKLNFLVNAGYDIHLLTQNVGNQNGIYNVFDSKIKQHNIELSGRKLQFLLSYKKQINLHIKSINPDVIMVCDNGLKGYVFPFIVEAKKPLLFESHGSKFIQENEIKSTVINKIKQQLVYKFKDIAVKKYTKLVLLNDEIASEWKHPDIEIINNPIWFQSQVLAPLDSKRVIAVGRHSYEKGFDRLLEIWKQVIKKHPDWILDIYGDANGTVDLKALVHSLKISDNVNFYPFTDKIEQKYPHYSIAVMTSRSEGFPMVAIEAMMSGLPVIAYNCSGGIQGIVKDNYNGFLVEDGNEESFSTALTSLIENKETRLSLAINARESVQKLSVESIMKQWIDLFAKIK